jgi:hypothetical protein
LQGSSQGTLSSCFFSVLLTAFKQMQEKWIYFVQLSHVAREDGTVIGRKRFFFDGFLDKLAQGATRKNKPGSQNVVFAWDKGLPCARLNCCVMNAFFGARPRHPSESLLCTCLTFFTFSLHSFYMDKCFLKCWPSFWWMCNRSIMDQHHSPTLVHVSADKHVQTFTARTLNSAGNFPL